MIHIRSGFPGGVGYSGAEELSLRHLRSFVGLGRGPVLLRQSIPHLNGTEEKWSALDLFFPGGVGYSGADELSLRHLRSFVGMGRGPVLPAHSLFLEEYQQGVYEPHF